jgi:hypothetical protein
MAKFYGTERSKIGSTSGTIIAWPVELDNTNPVSEENRSKLPSGYLKCDGSKYLASTYPELAEILGTGSGTRFARKNIDTTLISNIADNEFVVPDLGSKFIRPVPGVEVGSYNAINVVSKTGIEKRRSGMGVEATSTVGDVVQVIYTGKFVVPSQYIPITGKPTWTKGTSNLGYTDQSNVENSQVHPHMHFSTTYRCRIKSTNVVNSGLEPSQGSCAYKTASTVSTESWLAATIIPGCSSNTSPGANQPPCWAMASRDWSQNKLSPAGQAVDQESAGGSVFGCTGENTFNNICFTGGTSNELFYNCLLQGSSGSAGTLTYKLYNACESLGNGQPASYDDIVSYFLLNLFSCTVEGVNTPLNQGAQTSEFNGGTGDVTYNYIPGGLGVPTDWNNNSLYDVVPLNMNAASVTASCYPQVGNIMTEVDELNQADGDPTLHSHKILLSTTDHNFQMKTDAFELSPDNLKTQLTIQTDSEASLNSVTGPYIIIEYLIKI